MPKLPHTPSHSAERQALRKRFRAKRNLISPRQQAIASMAISKQLSRCPQFLRAKRIAVYFANDGEIDTLDIINRAWAMRKRTYMPAIGDNKQLEFVHFKANDHLATGKWGLLQPKNCRSILSPIALDLILLPLVAFDPQGNRLGRGGGYYDRFLSQLRRYRPSSKQGTKPHLMGLAHHCQQTEARLPIEKWDIALDSVVTDRQYIRCHRSRN